MRIRCAIFCVFFIFAAVFCFCETSEVAAPSENPETSAPPEVSEVPVEPVYIEEFDTIFSFRVMLSYNFMRFAEDDRHDEVFLSNVPLSIGAGFSWKRLSLKFSLSIPFVYNQTFSKSDALDLQMQYYGDKFIADIFLKNYRKLRPSLDFTSGTEIDMSVLVSGISAQYMFNHKQHSLKAAYNLTARQVKHAGSLLLGGNVYFASARSNDRVIEKYETRRNFLLVGPNVGYSYSWGFSYRMFLNLSLTIGANVGFELKTDRVFFAPSASPAFALGYHSKTWSCSLSATGLFVPLKTSVRVNDTLMTAKAVLTFVKRF